MKPKRAMSENRMHAEAAPTWRRSHGGPRRLYASRLGEKPTPSKRQRAACELSREDVLICRRSSLARSAQGRTSSCVRRRVRARCRSFVVLRSEQGHWSLRVRSRGARRPAFGAGALVVTRSEQGRTSSCDRSRVVRRNAFAAASYVVLRSLHMRSRSSASSI